MSMAILIVVMAIAILCIISKLGPKCKSCLLETVVKFIWKKLKAILWWCRRPLYVLLVCLVLSLIVAHILSVLEIYVFIGKTGLTETQYSPIVSDLILIVGFFAAIIPILTMRFSLKTLKENFTKEQGIQRSPVREKGVEDIKWMLPFYDKGKNITIFGGDFTWIGEKQELKPNRKFRDRICKLAGTGELKLVSYKKKEKIREAYKEKKLISLFDQLEGCFQYESKLKGVVCTIIERRPNEWKFLYRANPHESQHVYDNYALSDTDNTRELLHVLSELTKAGHWGSRP